MVLGITRAIEWVRGHLPASVDVKSKVQQILQAYWGKTRTDEELLRLTTEELRQEITVLRQTDDLANLASSSPMALGSAALAVLGLGFLPGLAICGAAVGLKQIWQSQGRTVLERHRDDVQKFLEDFATLPLDQLQVLVTRLILAGSGLKVAPEMRQALLAFHAQLTRGEAGVRTSEEAVQAQRIGQTLYGVILDAFHALDASFAERFGIVQDCHPMMLAAQDLLRKGQVLEAYKTLMPDSLIEQAEIFGGAPPETLVAIRGAPRPRIEHVLYQYLPSAIAQRRGWLGAPLPAINAALKGGDREVAQVSLPVLASDEGFIIIPPIPPQKSPEEVRSEFNATKALFEETLGYALVTEGILGPAGKALFPILMTDVKQETSAERREQRFKQALQEVISRSELPWYKRWCYQLFLPIALKFVQFYIRGIDQRVMPLVEKIVEEIQAHPGQPLRTSVIQHVLTFLAKVDDALEAYAAQHEAEIGHDAFIHQRLMGAQDPQLYTKVAEALLRYLPALTLLTDMVQGPLSAIDAFIRHPVAKNPTLDMIARIVKEIFVRPVYAVLFLGRMICRAIETGIDEKIRRVFKRECNAEKIRDMLDRFERVYQTPHMQHRLNEVLREQLQKIADELAHPTPSRPIPTVDLPLRQALEYMVQKARGILEKFALETHAGDVHAFYDEQLAPRVTQALVDVLLTVAQSNLDNTILMSHVADLLKIGENTLRSVPAAVSAKEMQQTEEEVDALAATIVQRVLAQVIGQTVPTVLLQTATVIAARLQHQLTETFKAALRVARQGPMVRDALDEGFAIATRETGILSAPDAVIG